eukprot:7012605-Alexandrium_andersonii.AAC.1
MWPKTQLSTKTTPCLRPRPLWKHSGSALRLLLSDLAFRRRGRARGRRRGARKALLTEVRKAHLRAFVEDDVPPEVAQPGTCAKLCRSFYGARAAPARWEALRASALESFGFARGKASARCFYNAELDVRRVVHGGGFTFTGYDADLDVVENLMNE